MACLIEAISDIEAVGEGPHWDVDTQSLYFVDVKGQTLNKFDPATNKHTRVSISPNSASFIIPVHNTKDHFLVPLVNKLNVIHWDGESDQFEVVKVLNETPYPCNDGKADSTGRVWFGTQNVNAEDLEATLPDGTLYRICPKGTLQPRMEKVKIANGLSWNDNIEKFYYIDSLRYAIYYYDFDITTGNIANEQQLFSLKTHDIPGIADGMTIDTDGNLWVAIYGGGRVIKVDGQKQDTLLQTIDFPCPLVTSVQFGGKDLDELYVTTAVSDGYPKSGYTYKILGLNVKGLPPQKAII